MNSGLDYTIAVPDKEAHEATVEEVPFPEPSDAHKERSRLNNSLRASFGKARTKLSDNKEAVLGSVLIAAVAGGSLLFGLARSKNRNVPQPFSLLGTAAPTAPNDSVPLAQRASSPRKNPEPHMVKSHTRNQRHGPGNQQTKEISVDGYLRGDA